MKQNKDLDVIAPLNPSQALDGIWVEEVKDHAHSDAVERFRARGTAESE